MAKVEAAKDAADVAGMLMGAEAPDTDTATLSMIGGKYRIGDVMLDPIDLRVMALLELIDSPLLGVSSEQGLSDIAKALYVVARRDEAVGAIAGVKDRQRALSKLEHLAEKSPEYFERYLCAIDCIGGDAYAEFERNAIGFLQDLGEGVGLQDIADVLTRMINDAFDGMTLLPDKGSSGSGKRKKK
jgi:hypothetical protein